jgi:hypothetical protein
VAIVIGFPFAAFAPRNDATPGCEVSVTRHDAPDDTDETYNVYRALFTFDAL